MFKVLVADDDPGILDATQLLLEEEGFEVITATDGEAVFKAWKGKPDIVLLDIWMPGMDGEEVCQKLRQNPETKNIPVIMVSASRDTQTIAKQSGANDFLVKPFDIDDLVAKIKKFVH